MDSDADAGVGQDMEDDVDTETWSTAEEEEAVPHLSKYNLRQTARLRGIPLSTWLDRDDSGTFVPAKDEEVSDEERAHRRCRAKVRKATRLRRPLSPGGFLRGISFWADAEIRGCKSCSNSHQACSLLEDNATYPCRLCVESHCECQVMIVPVRRVKCVYCESRNLRCSHLDGGQVGRPCRQCKRVKAECVTVPATDLPANQNASQFKNSSYPPPQHRESQQRECVPAPSARKEKRDCFLLREEKVSSRLRALSNPDHTSKHDDEERTSSKQTSSSEVNRLCQGTTDVTMSEERGQGAPLDEMNREALVELSEKTTNNKTANGKGLRRVIRTRFAHPISFDLDSTRGRSGSRCHFAWPSSEIMGNTLREVEVLEWPNGLGYTETSGGSRVKAEGRPTSICFYCTMARTQVALCPCHELRPIKGLDFDQMDLDALYNGLIEEVPENAPPIWPSCRDRKRSTEAWCSLCVTPASYRCVATQDDDANEKMVPPQCEISAGCGLQLCELCITQLMEDWEGDLQRMIQKALNDTKLGTADPDRLMGWRADIEFLLMDGLLMRNMLAVE